MAVFRVNFTSAVRADIVPGSLTMACIAAPQGHQKCDSQYNKRTLNHLSGLGLFSAAQSLFLLVPAGGSITLWTLLRLATNTIKSTVWLAWPPVVLLQAPPQNPTLLGTG